MPRSSRGGGVQNCYPQNRDPRPSDTPPWPPGFISLSCSLFPCHTHVFRCGLFSSKDTLFKDWSTVFTFTLISYVLRNPRIRSQTPSLNPVLFVRHRPTDSFQPGLEVGCGVSPSRLDHLAHLPQDVAGGRERTGRHTACVSLITRTGPGEVFGKCHTKCRTRLFPGWNSILLSFPVSRPLPCFSSHPTSCHITANLSLST